MYKLRITPIGAEKSQPVEYTIKGWFHMRWFALKMAWHINTTYGHLGTVGSVLGEDIGAGSCIYYGIYNAPKTTFVKLIKVTLHT